MTVVTLRPSSVLGQSTTPTVTGAASALAAVTDNSDASYIVMPTYAYIRFLLPAQTVTATQRVKSCTARVRAGYSGSGTAPQVTNTQLMDKIHSNAAGAFQVKRSSGGPSTSTGPVAYSTPLGNSWTGLVQNSQSSFAVSVQTQWLPNVNERVHEIYVDVDINNQPLVSGVSVTNITNNAAPTISWVYGDADGDPQTWYRVKIFDAATIAQGNFSPDTSTAAYDSGNLQGASTSIDLSQSQTVFFDRFGNPYIVPGAPPPALLANVTYTAYVKVGQDWPVPIEGTPWWSTWANSSTFLVSFTPPITPVINSVSVLADTNQYRALINALISVNELTADNASFEGSIGQWVSVTNCSVVVTGAQAADGTQSMMMTATALGDMEAKCNFDLVGNPWVMGNEIFTALASFRANTTGRSCQVGLELFDIAGTSLSTTFGSSISDLNTGWTQALYQPTIVANARQAKIHVKVLAAAAGEKHFVDKCDVHAGPVTGWTPGAYRNDQGDVIIERLEYLNDSRGPAENWFHPQVASCGTYLQNQGYGFAINTAQGDLNFKWLDKVINSVGDTPAGMLDWRPSLATTSQIDFGNWFYGGTAYMVPAPQGQPMTFSVWAWVDTGTFVAQPFIVWRDQTGAFLSASGGGTPTLTTTPQRISCTFTPPGNAILCNGAVLNFASDNGHHVYFTRAGLGPGTLPVDGKRAQGLPTGISSTGSPVGASWKQIRLAQPEVAGLSPGFAFGQIEQAPDYDYPPGRPAIYRASITYSLGTNLLKSAYSNQIVTYAAPPAVTLLRSVTNPQLQVAVNRRKQATFPIIQDATVFHPLGADQAPVQVRDWYGGEDGQLIVITATEAQRARLNDLLYSNDVLLVQWAQGGRSYVQVTDRSQDETITSDIDFCDAEGGALQQYLRYTVHTLTYIETTMP